MEYLDTRSNPTAAQRRFSELLAVLIEDWDRRKNPVPAVGPVATLRFLMDQNGLKQKDLVDVFGTESVVSEVLKGKRGFSKAHITKLARRFRVAPEVFLES